MIDKLLIKYASPTLAGVKTGSLFKVYTHNKSNLNIEIKNYNLLLNSLDVYLDIIYTCDKYDLIYLYRSKMLLNDLKNKSVIDFLSTYGYECINIEDYIFHLKVRFKFFHKTPHEIGVFLGYPLNDVKDFIKYKGNNFKICGCWKVYNDVELCINKFKIFKKYTQLFTYLYDDNYPLEILIHS
ncbi:DUF3793 family protein [Terrisporobacter mayombei]|uniref:DUF3793 domain-containing protein n=1 Tax=Terrisporobacter mayombei TaxID=1541 RepID=A0ABY9Q8L5_9FIRM|nr:DUF3793 family protein [Terrisporobacter mayombei]MCC3869532.1 DUF3793 family protein [Terrisporobacter mayombei]WMT83531.1 hypothetical protein TEMA_40490 [Terrisporobacter mayombei]